MKTPPRWTAFVILLLLIAAPAWAQKASTDDEQTATPTVHQLRWISAEAMRILLGAGPSGFVQWGRESQRLWINENLNTVSVQGTPQFQTFVEETIKRFDVEPATIEFQFHVLRASTGGQAVDTRLPAFLKKVVADIGAVTRYNQFELIDSPLLRATEGATSRISGEGSLAYSIGLRPAQVVPESGTRRIRVESCSVEYRALTGYTSASGDLVASPKAAEKEMSAKSDYQPVVQPLYRRAGVSTSFSIDDGATIVLGASRMPRTDAGDDSDNWAIVTVVTARIL